MLQITLHQLGTQLKTVLIGKHKYFLKNIKHIDIFCNIHEQHCINQIDYYHRYVDIFRKLIKKQLLFGVLQYCLFVWPGSFYWEVDKDQSNKEPELLFTENETNHKRLFNVDGQHYSKDAFHNYVIKGLYMYL